MNNWLKIYEWSGTFTTLTTFVFFIFCLIYFKKTRYYPMYLIFINISISLVLDFYAWYLYKVADDYGYFLVPIYVINNFIFLGLFLIYPLKSIKLKKYLKIGLILFSILTPIIFQLSGYEKWSTTGSLFHSFTMLLLCFFSIYHFNLKFKSKYFILIYFPISYLMAFLLSIIVDALFVYFLNISQKYMYQFYALKNIVWALANIVGVYIIVKLPSLTPASTPKPSPPPRAQN